MRRLYVAGWSGDEVVVGERDAHYLVHVLRLGRGARVRLFDGRGREADATIVAIDDGAAALRVEAELDGNRPPHPLHVLLAVAKGPAMDAAIRMVTEAGATHVHPVLTARSVPRGERGDRWARIAEAAARQCGRADVPEVVAVAMLPDALAALPAGLDARVAVPGAPRLPAATGPAAVLVGPEGGLTTDEIRRATAAGFVPMGLGRFVLRCETAAAVAVALVAP